MQPQFLSLSDQSPVGWGELRHVCVFVVLICVLFVTKCWRKHFFYFFEASEIRKQQSLYIFPVLVIFRLMLMENYWMVQKDLIKQKSWFFWYVLQERHWTILFQRLYQQLRDGQAGKSGCCADPRTLIWIPRTQTKRFLCECLYLLHYRDIQEDQEHNWTSQPSQNGEL